MTCPQWRAKVRRLIVCHLTEGWISAACLLAAMAEWDETQEAQA